MSGIKKTLGGDRLGSGNKNKVYLHGYERSTHDLGRVWRGSTAVGVLKPVYIELMLNGDTFDINMDTIVKTLPTTGPLMGQFKLQVDVFGIPIRLYNAQMHNDPTRIGMDVKKIMFPMMEITARTPDFSSSVDPNQQQIHPTSLLYDLEISGLGKEKGTTTGKVTRRFQAITLLGLWDIYKTYYANKQEEIGAVISNNIYTTENWVENTAEKQSIQGVKTEINNESNVTIKEGEKIILYTNAEPEKISLNILDSTGEKYKVIPQIKTLTIEKIYPTEIVLRANANTAIKGTTAKKGWKIETWNTYEEKGEITVETFPLENIDDMRDNILRQDKNIRFVLNGDVGKGDVLPYKATIGNNGGINVSRFPMAGLPVKTYQSDRFNNWLSTEWIEGETGVNAITRIDTSSGSFSMDDLNLMEKMYNLLNRIAISGGSLYDWYEAVYGVKVSRSIESPVYMGGMSSEIAFAEVVDTAGQSEPLGTLAGRGIEKDIKKGTIRIKSHNEPQFVMVLLSLTPRIDYSQGNKWYNNLENLDQLHKPALDQIGFQDLLTDEMAAWDTDIENGEIKYKSAGKQPSWIQYQTNVNKNAGTFAIPNNTMFMVLNRRYEHDENGEIKDLTTYIDPIKYNYAFADASREAQNFWVQIGVWNRARRKMSGNQIPNL